MKHPWSFLLFSISLLYGSYVSTAQQNFAIQYLDEYVITNDTIFDHDTIGGLSGITYQAADETYYMVCDDAKKPRFYRATIAINAHKITDIEIDTLIRVLEDTTATTRSVLDLESIQLVENGRFIFTSEGDIKHQKSPRIFTTNAAGKLLSDLELPTYFTPNDSAGNQPRHNASFEGITTDITNDGYWAAMELPLVKDGEEPSFSSGGAPVRITHFNAATGKADRQFTYALDALSKDPKGDFAVNGVTALLQLGAEQFLIIERGYVAGYGSQGNTVKIYLVDSAQATDTLDNVVLPSTINTATKTLLFDFESVRNQLTRSIVDNIEGITLGPLLPDGTQTLILVSDNNFNPPEEQLNQVILLALTTTE